MDAEQREALATWDRIIAEQEALQGLKVMALIKAAAQAEEEFDIDELDQGRDSSAC
jgi:hypothetical protein